MEDVIGKSTSESQDTGFCFRRGAPTWWRGKWGWSAFVWHCYVIPCDVTLCFLPPFYERYDVVSLVSDNRYKFIRSVDWPKHDGMTNIKQAKSPTVIRERAYNVLGLDLPFLECDSKERRFLKSGEHTLWGISNWETYELFLFKLTDIWGVTD